MLDNLFPLSSCCSNMMTQVFFSGDQVGILVVRTIAYVHVMRLHGFCLIVTILGRLYVHVVGLNDTLLGSDSHKGQVLCN